MLMHTGSRLRGIIDAKTVDTMYSQNVAQLYALLERLNERVTTLAYNRESWGAGLDALQASTVDLDSRLSNLDETKVGEWRADAALLAARLADFDKKLAMESTKQMILVIGGSGLIIGGVAGFIARMRRSKRPVLIGSLVGAGTGLAVFGINRALAKQ